MTRATCKTPHSVPVDSKALSAAENSLLTKVLRARLVVTKTNVEVLRQDPNSPLYSVKSFDELNLLVVIYIHLFV